jgi:DNA-binding NarL/FixJ family response regulator
MPIRVLLADDHSIVREGVKSLLEREGLQVAGEASNGHELLNLAQKTPSDVAIIDVSMPVLNGIDTARELRKLSPKTKIILLTRHDEDQYVTEALHAGVRGYVLKSQLATDLVYAIQQVCRGLVYLCPSVSGAVVDAYLAKRQLSSDPLTSRERQVLQLVGEGKSSKEVANFLGISIKTAESHRCRIMQKLDIHETASLVRYAIRRGLVQP